MIWLYRLLWLVLLPIIALWLLFRVLKGKEDTSRLKERLGLATVTRPNGRLLWLHAASVGEAMSILPLVGKLLDADSGLNILITTGTRTSADLLAARLPQMDEDRLFHQYVPLDFWPCISMFLSHWQPQTSAFVESEFWPELLTNAPKPVLLNARISDRSFPKYQKYGFLFKPLIHRFEACLAQSDQDAQRLKQLGAQNVTAAGNLKFDADPLSAHERELQRMENALKSRKVVVYASTHNGEEVLFAKLHKKLAAQVPNLISLIVPRHPERGAEVLSTCTKAGFKAISGSAGHVKEIPENAVLLRSHGQLPDEKCSIYIANTLGELGLWFRLADAVVMGGSFVDLGKVSGHNPIEPLRLLAPTVVGPHMDNFTEMLEILQRHDILPQLKNTDELESLLAEWLTEEIRPVKRRKDKIKAAMTELSGSADVAVKTIKKLLK